MADKERDIEEITFFGKQDTDTALEFIEKGNFLYALNILNSSSGTGNKGIVKSVKGNLEIVFTLPAGTNKTIGTAEDHENNKFYFFNWNSNSNHGIYQFDGLQRKVVPVLINLTDTGNYDILKLDKNFLILHADVVRDNLLYWVDGKNNARKTNINKLFDKSSTGYGNTILESFINAYKKTSDFAPTAVYFSDTTKPFNRLYGSLRRFAIRYIYDDGEFSNWSDFSSIALPDKEPFTGIKTIPTNNNGLKITMETGDLTVDKIEIGMQSTTGEPNNEGVLNWQKIATLNKKRLNISDNSTYTYNFYNDGTYPVTAYEKVIRPYNFMQKQPLCQSVAKAKMVYTGGKEGFDFVPIDVQATVSYANLFIDNGTNNELNKPSISITPIANSGDYMSNGDTYINLDGSIGFVRGLGNRNARNANAYKVTIGKDVKKGNKFNIAIFNSGQSFIYSYTALATDTATTVANQIKAMLVSSGVIIRKSTDGVDRYIYTNTADGDGNIYFEFVALAVRRDGYFDASSSVNPVQFNTLKDTGESIRNIKLGSSVKLGIEYEDFDGRKSLIYTVDALIIGIKTINELVKVDGKTGYQTPIITLQINHRPPVWAKYYQIVRSDDLVYADYIQMLIQQVINVQGTTTEEYQDLVVGSLFTYNKIHPNSNLQYTFKAGDRIRLLNKTSDNSYYDFFETEILSYEPVVRNKIASNIVTNGTPTVTVQQALTDNIGRYIVVEGSERLITGRPSGTTYTLDAPLGSGNATYLYYEIVDTRGVIKIRKPTINIADLSVVEIYSPAVGGAELLTKQFYEFQKKFKIINAGTENAFHGGNQQDQTAIVPAIIKINEGTAYVRNRELPITNNYPGAQVVISPIEDPSFSDFYPSLINDNGRPNIEDTGVGEVQYGSRMRFSNNSIEDTKINGLNDFDSGDREDYNDKYGDIKRTVFDINNIFTFKSLRSAYVPVDSKITIDDTDTALRVGSANFLNPIQYMAWEGGIGNNPEAYCSNGTHKYIVSTNSGVIIRIGANGEEPISKTFFLDKEVRELLTKAAKYNAKIFLGFNRKLALLVITIEGYEQSIYFDGFNGWIVLKDTFTVSALLEIVTPPTNGLTTITSDNQFFYSPNANYIGSDSFTYRALVGGVWSQPRKVCLTGKEIPNRQTGWRAKATPYTCLVVSGNRNGLKSFTTLEEYYLDDNSLTGRTKPNTIGDADYVAPVFDSVLCSVQYTLNPVIDAEISTPYISNTLNIRANAATPISIVDGEYRINGGAWVSIPGTVNNGNTVEARKTSSGSYTTLATAILTIGGVAVPFNITTKANNVIACGVDNSFGGGQSFPSETIITLGSGLGNVQLNFDAVGVPDKFIVIYNGVEVINTGYRGDIGQQSALNSALAARGLPPETIAGVPSGTASFIKTTASPTTAIVRVFAPIVGTAWDYVLGCPVTTFTAQRTADFQKNNCVGTGETGSIVTFTKNYTSTISQSDANNQASSDPNFNSQGQANANSSGTCNPPLPSNAVGILVIDLFENIDACAFVDTPGVIPYQIPVYKGQNFLPNDGTPAANCWALASDFINQGNNLDYRFQFNIARLLNTYPSIPSFVFKVRGRGPSASTLNGSYSLKGADQGNMIMQGSQGTYIPSTANSTDIGVSAINNKLYVGGADGNIGLAFGADILTFTYNVANKTITLS